MIAKDLFLEGRDDTRKLGLGKEGVAYATMDSKDVMNQPGGVAGKVRKRFDMIKSVTNQKGIESFKNLDKGQKVGHAFKEIPKNESLTPAQVVNALLRL